MAGVATVSGRTGAGPGVLTLSSPIGRVPGVTAARVKAFARIDVTTVGDLLRLAPRRFDDRRTFTPVASLGSVPEGEERTVLARVVSGRTSRWRGGMAVFEALVADETGSVRARWYRQPWISKTVTAGARVILHGPVRDERGRLLSSPEVERLPDDADREATPHPSFGRFVPVHPLTRGLTATAVRKAVWAALASLGPVADPLPPACLGEGPPPLPTLSDAIRTLHFPGDLASAERARGRLAYDELFLHEVMLARRKRARKAVPGIPFRWTPTLDRRIRRRFPFAPTPGQEAAIREIVGDLGRPTPMNRLLQGDVGSGKTAVAAYACLMCVANRHQAAFMAPTEILARQHETTLERVLSGSRVRVVTLSGSLRARERRDALARIAAGEADLVVGTHAVISRGVEFARLGLAVVDEQHKFGVRQRRDLVTKGPAPHCLVMTATPIPRTLAMVVYGDLDVTVLPDRPPGRGPTETCVVRPGDRAATFARIREELDRGRQVFVVYPLVEESDRGGLRDATAGRDEWARTLPGRRVGLVHGQMDARLRAKAMEDFRARRTDVLVATVVIEVGIDVPNATVLFVEHAERFGLSQLHQLRGRVGRGEGGGLCVLMDRTEGGGTPERLRVLASTEDGFEVAEADLRLRGAGDLLGTRQHGAPAFTAARLPEDLPLLLRARSAVSGLLSRDREMASPDVARLRARVEARERSLGDPTAGG